MKKIIIWDYDFEPIKLDGQIILWSNYGDGSKENIVMSRMVEDIAEEVRRDYLGWLYRMGNKLYKDKTIIEILTFRNEFSYWWMSLLNEKSNFSKSPNIVDACKMIAFNKWATPLKINNLYYFGSNKSLAACLEIWCAQRAIIFQKDNSVKISNNITYKIRLFEKLPYFMQGIFWILYYIFHRSPLRKVGRKKWMQTNAKLTFVSYFANLIPDKIKDKKFGSYYWNDLVVAVSDSGTASNWLHIYVPDKIVTNPKIAKKLINLLNHENKELQTHVMLDSFLSLKVLFNIFNDWLQLRKRATIIEKIIFNSKDEEIDFWPLLKNDWNDSFYGKTSISNVWHYCLFEEAIFCLPKQESGVYLQENIDWEFAFLHLWKNAGHGKLIGFPHSNIRFWDLRYFFDLRTFFSIQSPVMMPLPDIIATNGPMTKEHLENGGYPTKMLIEVEAVRYNYLQNFLELIEKAKPQNHFTNNDSKIQLLVLGDIEVENTHLQMNILSNISTNLKDKIRIIFKPHPLCSSSKFEVKNIQMESSYISLDQLLQGIDIAFTGAITSAAVDAYLFGIPVISVLDQKQLNLSPLRGKKDGVFFVGNSIDFELAFSAAIKSKIHKRIQNIFYLDSLLPRWKKLLNLH